MLHYKKGITEHVHARARGSAKGFLTFSYTIKKQNPPPGKPLTQISAERVDAGEVRDQLAMKAGAKERQGERNDLNIVQPVGQSEDESGKVRSQLAEMFKP